MTSRSFHCRRTSSSMVPMSTDRPRSVGNNRPLGTMDCRNWTADSSSASNRSRRRGIHIVGTDRPSSAHSEIASKALGVDIVTSDRSADNSRGSRADPCTCNGRARMSQFHSDRNTWYTNRSVWTRRSRYAFRYRRRCNSESTLCCCCDTDTGSYRPCSRTWPCHDRCDFRRRTRRYLDIGHRGYFLVGNCSNRLGIRSNTSRAD